MKLRNSFKLKPLTAAMRAYSLIELLMVLGCLSSCAAVAWLGFANVRGSANDMKLQQDVSVLNRAVKVYLLSGGQIPPHADGAEVIRKLKSMPSKLRQKNIAGLRQSMIDPRLMGVATSRDGFPRAVWDNPRQTFIVENSGPGFREFMLDAGAATGAGDDVRNVALPLDNKDGWIWAYGEQAPSARGAGTIAGTHVAALEEPRGNAAMGVLKAPDFSLPSGYYDGRDFNPDLRVSLINRDEPNISDVYYSIGDGPWQRWNGVPLSVPRSMRSQVKAYSEPLDADLHERSPIASADYSTIVFGGTTSGLFNKVYGESGKESNQIWGEASDLFTWGGTKTGTTFTPANELRYTGVNFSNALPEESFQIGSLTYFNSQSMKGTQISGTQIEITLTLSTLGIVERLPCRISLINTTTDEADDYIAIPSFPTKLATTIQGREFWFVITFQPANSDAGFASATEVHPKAGHSLTVPVFGRFTSTPP